jgi:hypothetical protein
MSLHFRSIRGAVFDSASNTLVRFKVFATVTMNNAVFWDRRVAIVRTEVSEELSASIIGVTRFGELVTTLRKNRSVRRLLVTASVVPISPILLTPMKEALSSP